MSFTVTVQPSGLTFNVEAGEKILDAALRQSVGLPYGCKDGACGSCKGKVLQGELSHGPHQEKALTSSEATQGFALFCCATAQTNLEIECRTVTGMGDIPVKKLPSRVASLEKVTSDVAIVKLQLPTNERLQYLAGQYVEIILRDGKRRSYSMASAPHNDGPIELHIRHMPGGVFTDQVFSTLKERDILRFEGPFGSFFLREDDEKPILFLASGTGFAPIKAIVEHAIHKNITRPMTLYWGARKKADIYQWELVQSWVQQLPHFKFVPVLSEALAEDAWDGRTGFVHQAVIADLLDLSNYQVYACGAPPMVDAARRDFSAQCGLPADEFYADAFTSEADKV